MATDQEAIAAQIESLRHRIDDIAARVVNGTYDELNAPIHRLARNWRERPWLIILAALGALVAVAVVVSVILRVMRKDRD
jgi:hypothetical protein